MKRNAILVPVVSLILAGGAAFSAQAISRHYGEPGSSPTDRSSWSPPAQAPKFIQTFCDHGNRVYVNRRSGDLAVVPQDPTCRKSPARPTATTRPTATKNPPPSRSPEIEPSESEEPEPSISISLPGLG